MPVILLCMNKLRFSVVADGFGKALSGAKLTSVAKEKKSLSKPLLVKLTRAELLLCRIYKDPSCFGSGRPFMAVTISTATADDAGKGSIIA